MGLFDKLKSAIDTVVDTVKDSAQGGSDPLQDETIKKYYEIIYGMQLSTGRGYLAPKENIIAKRYVEFYLEQPCDETKLEKALELCNSTLGTIPNNKLEEQLYEFNKELKAAKKYVCKKTELYRICEPEVITEIKAEYDKILNIVKDNINHAIFAEGLTKKIREKYSCVNDSMKADYLTYIAIADSFIDGNSITQKLVLEYLFDIYKNRVNNSNPESFEKPLDVITKMALKALHFEKYGKNKSEYISITESDCREFILNDKYYKEKLDKHPFDQERYIKTYVDNIMCWNIFRIDYSSHKDYELFWFKAIGDYFEDMVCNLAWKTIAENYTESINAEGENISESNNISDIVNMFCDYFSN